jgi:hypothetical protein
MQKYNKICNQQSDAEEITLFALLKLNLNQLKMMSDCDIPVTYYRYVPMYEDYLQMRRSGEKMAYITAVLTERYQVSESTVKRVIKALSLRVTV